jgi:large subunit ribosomal protein L9
MNSLIPKKFAVPSNEAGQIKTLKENEERGRAGEVKRIEEAVAKISGITINLTLKANEKNHLFASLTAQKLSEILKKEKGVEIDSQYIVLKQPIKEIGTFDVPVEIGDKETKFTLSIQAQ